MFTVIVAAVCLCWYIAVLIVCVVGYVQLYRNYRAPPPPAAVEHLAIAEIPQVTIIRPVKGIEPALYECLASTFRQSYPSAKLTICFCVSTRGDPALPILEKLLTDFPTFDARIYVENEDASASLALLGPNPKIRNMSRAYREAKGDIIWIIDCNVWVAPGVAGRMVDTLCGFTLTGQAKPYKLVHQLPLVVDITASSSSLGSGLLGQQFQAASSNSAGGASTFDSHALSQTTNTQYSLQIGGGRLEEMFLASAHAKFYTAINTVLVAPCIVGKSTMFRRSHLDAITSTAEDSAGTGIDYFSQNICEDHLLGDMLWKKQIPAELAGETWGKHHMVFGDLAVQPMAGMSITEYLSRRVRWLRVRKFTVTLATFVEPGTEAFLCSAYGAFALTTLPWCGQLFGIPHTWLAFCIVWMASVGAWVMVDWTLYRILHSMASIKADPDTPLFAAANAGGGARRPFKEWFLAWLGRESLALPIWMWAIYGGTTVAWRGQRFRVGMDMKVHSLDKTEVPSLQRVRQPSPRSGSPAFGKARRE